MNAHCDDLVSIALHVRGTNAVNGSSQRLIEALEVAYCCHQKGRSDLALELLDQIDSFANGKEEPFASQVKEQRCDIANGNISGSAPKLYVAESPPLHILGWNFGSAMVRWAKSGFKVRPKKEVKRIIKICQTCPNLVDNVCNACGCQCVETEQVLNKIWLASESCPLKKW